MKAAEYIDTLRHEGELLAGAAEQAGWDAAVPPCPGWVVRDLVHHTGSVHRWAAGYVAGSTTPVPMPATTGAGGGATAPSGEPSDAAVWAAMRAAATSSTTVVSKLESEASAESARLKRFHRMGES